MNPVDQSLELRIHNLQTELFQKEKELDDCVKDKEEFIDIATHDLKAPLRKLVTFSERLLQRTNSGLNEDAILYVKKIQKTVATMQSLIDGLAELSNIGTEFDFESCDLNETIKDVLNELSGLADNNKVAIRIKDLPTIDANHEQIKNVFKNLLENSIKFQPEGQVGEITVESKVLAEEEKINFNLAENKVYFQIKFADNGIGFNQESADKILKPFQRLNGISSFPGNGLGLAICKKVIDMHSGIFLAQGKENVGSVFILILPQIQQ